MSPGFIIVGIAIIAVHVVGVCLYNRGVNKKLHNVEKVGICLMSLTTIATLIYGNCAKTLL
jgi:Mn2+/Fe2+ NRAMP family transporter